jgi:hypothetical protein
VAALYEGSAYETIRETKPDLAFQLYLIDGNFRECHRQLTYEKVYIRNLKP